MVAGYAIRPQKDRQTDHGSYESDCSISLYFRGACRSIFHHARKDSSH